MLDAQTLRRVLHDFFKFNPKDFYVKGSGTGYLISLVRRLSASQTSPIKVGFQWYVAPATSDGNSSNLLIKLRKSLINENVPVENMADSFQLVAGTTDEPKVNYVRLTTSQHADGTTVSANIDITDEMLPDPPGSLDVAPSTSSRALWILTTDDVGVIDESALYIGGVSVLPQLVKTQCGESLWRMAWAHSLGL